MTRSRRRAHPSAAGLLLVLGAALAAGLPGCRAGYLLKQAGGQIHILQHRTPLETALASPELTDGQKARIRYILEVKAWGTRALGLDTGKSYTRLYDTGGKPVAWNLVACPQDSTRPVTWWFPVVGSVPYLGFFDREDALAEAADLRARGCDTSVRTVAAYSSLGWFEDPVFTPMLGYGAADLASLILHESVHATVYVAGHTAFNETFAEFVADCATERFLREREGPAAPTLAAWRDAQHDQTVIAAALGALKAALDRLYAGPLTRTEKVTLREDVFRDWRTWFETLRPGLKTGDYDGFPPPDLNNAFVASYLAYHTDTRVLAELLDALGGDLRAFLAAFRDLPGGEEPMAYARRLAAERRATAGPGGAKGAQ